MLTNILHLLTKTKVEKITRERNIYYKKNIIIVQYFSFKESNGLA